MFVIDIILTAASRAERRRSATRRERGHAEGEKHPMTTDSQIGTQQRVGPVAPWFAFLAEQWESRKERRAEVADQIAAIYAKLVEWRMTPETRDELDHATIAYSRVCAEYECCEWLPFDVMPNWEDDLFCIMMDEDLWREQRDKNRMGYEIAEMIRSREANVNDVPWQGAALTLALASGSPLSS